MMIEKVKKLKEAPVTVKASIAYTICNIIQKCLSFITVPLFTRLLTTDEYGQFSVYTAWQGIFAIFLTLNLPYGSFSKAMIAYEDKRNQYIASCETICMGLSLLFLMIYLPFQRIWSKYLELSTLLVLLLVFEILAQAGLSFWSGKKRFEFEYKSVVGATLLIAICAPLLAIILVLTMNDRGTARIIGYAVVYIIIGGYFFIYNYMKSRKLFNIDMVKYALRFNLPLIVYYLSQVIFNQSDRLMIKRYIDTSSAGIYSVAYTLSMMLVFVLNAINNSYVPWFYIRLSKKDTKQNKQISLIIALIMFVLLMGVIWAAPEIIYVMAGQKYHDAIWVVPPVCISNMLLLYTQYCINIEFFFEDKKSLVFASILSAVSNIALNAVFIPKYGFIAAGYTTMFSYILFFVFNYIAMKSVLRKNNTADDMYDKPKLIMVLMSFMGLAALGTLLYNFMIIRYCILLVILIVMFIMREKIIAIVKQVMNLKKEKEA